jgi:hypothetical protein
MTWTVDAVANGKKFNRIEEEEEEEEEEPINR